MDNQGSILVGTTATLAGTGADHTNSGTINIAGGNLTLTQYGTTPTFTNTGLIGVSPGLTLRVNYGTFTNASPGTITGGGTLYLYGTTFYGEGSITADVNNTSSDVHPSLPGSRGVLDITLTVAAPGVLGNDSDPDGAPLTAVLVAGPSYGTVTLNGVGSFTYSPELNYNGPDAFT